MKNFTLDRSAVPKYVARKILQQMAWITLALLVFYILDFGKARENAGVYFFIFLLAACAKEIWQHRITKLEFDSDRKLLLLTTRQFLYPEDEELIPFEKVTFVYRSPDTFYIRSGNREAGNFICDKSLLTSETVEHILVTAKELSLTIKDF